MGTGNQMAERAAKERLLKEKEAERQSLDNAKKLQQILIGIIEKHPRIADGQKIPTIQELMDHITRPKGYEPDKARSDYLTILLLNATHNQVTLWHTNGAPAITLEGANLPNSLPSKKVIAAVRVMAQVLQAQ